MVISNQFPFGSTGETFYISKLSMATTNVWDVLEVYKTGRLYNDFLQTAIITACCRYNLCYWI